MKLTALYLVKNEEEFLPLSVATVIGDVDEVVIIDTKSTDATLAIARDIESQNKSKVRVLQYDQDFDEACEFNLRNRALREVTGDWLMMLDADQLLTDGWRKEVDPFLRDKRCESIHPRYEHLVGSYEYIHRSFDDRQKNVPGADPNIPLHQGTFFKKTPTLYCRAAADTVPQFRKEHHGRFDESVAPHRTERCETAAIIHYGFAKRDMMRMAKYRIERGDYGHEPDRKQQLVSELDACGNPFRFIGSVCRVAYNANSWMVSAVMKPAFDNTYRLELDAEGFIQKRTLIATGESL